jgi:2-methylisocitrate lyase-like PEP mutase family enzyme
MTTTPRTNQGTTQAERARQFQALHAAGPGFVVANPWDVGSARLLALAGFQALASTSAGHCFSQGMPDYAAARDPVLAHLAALASATDLPLSADLEDGFGATPDEVAETIRLAAAAGVVGASVEDHSGVAGAPLTDLGQAVDRVRAAVGAARGLPFPFLITARAENFMLPQPDLAATISRLQRYQEAGADVLFAPGITDAGQIATLVRAVDRPVNLMVSVPGMRLSVQQVLDLGVRRVSLGGSLARAAYGALLRAATELQTTGTLGYTEQAVPGARLNALFKPWGR